MSSRAVLEVDRPAASDTMSRILTAAEQCMARFGTTRVSMADVAAQAGLSRGAIYLHFADRKALVDAVLTRTAHRFVASSAESISRRRTLEAQVAEAAVFIRTHLGDSMVTLRLPADEESLLATLLTSRLTPMVEEWVEFWLPYLAAAEGRGELRPGIDRRQAAEWIVRMMLSFAVMPAVSFDADQPEQVRAFVRAFMVNGLRALPSQRGTST
ncbi:MAG TPA: helix-turn-helix domain-containing protein [Acidimicrobiales bacterium]|jgi:AcrR family transcriptional regulator|nr:helix-turn-helix domain-containing protein [Acidimicrobiales bacterium]